MSKVILACLVVFLYSASAMAEKPESAGNGKSTAEEHAAKATAMNKKKEIDELEKEGRRSKEEKHEKANKMKEESEKPKGLEKQYEKKSSQEQKELGKGSEQGQESSSGKKKWWKFWE